MNDLIPLKVSANVKKSYLSIHDNEKKRLITFFHREKCV